MIPGPWDNPSGKCESWCSQNGYCGTSEIYKENGVDCSDAATAARVDEDEAACFQGLLCRSKYVDLDWKNTDDNCPCAPSCRHSLHGGQFLHRELANPGAPGNELDEVAAFFSGDGAWVQQQAEAERSNARQLGKCSQ